MNKERRSTPSQPHEKRGSAVAYPLNGTANRFRKVLLEVSQRAWFCDAFRRIVPGRVPFAEPLFKSLVQLGVIDESGRAQKRVNTLGDCVFLTDGPWVQHRSKAVYPFEDEAAILLRYAQRISSSDDFDAVVDLAAGCGHNAIAHPCAEKYALDLNSHAKHFVRLNAELNQCRVRFQKNDIRDGLPTSLLRKLEPKDHVLFMANMPFAVSPESTALPRTTDGGQSGNELTLAAIRALGAFEGQGVALLLTNSLYSTTHRRWQICDEITRHFPQLKVRWKLARQVRVWRINGERAELNPMQVRTGLPRKADCEINVSDTNRVNMRKAYSRLATQLERQGWDKLGCGVLQISLNR